jgi:hypothetical protein
VAASVLAVVFDCLDSLVVARFWSAALGEDLVERDTGEYRVGDPNLGGPVVDIREDPNDRQNPDRWTVMADPEGNEFCVTGADLTGWFS